MPTIVIDQALRTRLDIRDSFLQREDWTLHDPEPSWLAAVTAQAPDLAVVLHDPPRIDAVALVRALRAEEATGLQVRIVAVLGEAEYARHRDYLASQRVACFVNDVDSETLVAAMIDLLNVPTRVNVRAKVVFEMQGRSDENALFNGRMLDVSTGGFLFESHKPFAEGQTLYCFFSLGREEPVIFASGRIARAMGGDETTMRYGVEFVDIRLDDRRRIADFVYSTSGEQVAYTVDAAAGGR